MKRSKLLLRSMMFVPGHNEKLLTKASQSLADALILDIEDSVMPVSNKQIARNMIKEKVDSGLFENIKIFPRINDRESGYCLKDVYTLTIEGVTGFVYPKSMKGEDIYFFDKLLETIEYEKGFQIGTFKIVPLIETAAAVLNVQEICLASNRVIAIAFGCEDFVADLEGIHTESGDALFTARALIAMAARATGVIPIDTVHINVHDLDDLRRNAELARTLGFEGMLILHPKEISIAHEYYTPSNKEYENAKEMLRLSEEAASQDKGVAVYNGKFVGPPMVVAAKKTIERHERCKQRNS